MIENKILKLQSPKIPVIIKKSQGLIETQLINRVRRNKKAIVVAEISKLKDSMSVIEMFDEIVLIKGLCSKASYYRYVASLKKSNEIKVKQY